MTKEQIEKAARDYALDQLGIVGLPERAEAMKAFMAGARWRVNSVWHDIDKDLPDCGRNVVNEDWFDFEAKSVLDLKTDTRKISIQALGVRLRPLAGRDEGIE